MVGKIYFPVGTPKTIAQSIIEKVAREARHYDGEDDYLDNDSAGFYAIVEVDSMDEAHRACDYISKEAKRLREAFPNIR